MLLRCLLAASLLFSPLAAVAQEQDEAMPPPALPSGDPNLDDFRCFEILYFIGANVAEENRTGFALMTVYYFAKLKTRIPDLSLADLRTRYAADLRSMERMPEYVRCTNEYRDFSRQLVEAGA